MTKTIILASASVRRKKILEDLGLEFKVIRSDVEERIDKSLKPEVIVKNLALNKAEDVTGKILAQGLCGEALVVGADTIVVAGLEDDHPMKIVGKPGTPEDARNMLKTLSGTTHHVFTGIGVVDTVSGKKLTGFEMSVVRMKKLSDQEIESASSRHLDKAGAYGIQEKDDAFVTLISGPYDNVVGLPVERLRQMLAELGVSI